MLMLNDLLNQNQQFVDFFKHISFIYNKAHLKIYKELKTNSYMAFKELEDIEIWYTPNRIEEKELLISQLNILV